MAKKRKGAGRAWLPWLALPAALLAGELGLRALRGSPALEPLPPGFQYSQLDAAKPFFARRPAGAGWVLSSRRALAAPGEFVMPKPPGVWRVFVVGGSVAQPFFRDPLDRAVWTKAVPGKKLELINCGMGGYDSARDLATVRETLDYAPDLVVVLSGNNENMPPPLRSPRVFLANRLLRGLWGWRLVQDRISAALGPEPDPLAPGRLEANLRAMAREAKARGVPLVLCTLPTNLRDVAPSSFLPWESERFVAGWAAWERGRYARARGFWTAALQERPDDAGLAWMLARAFDKDRKLDEARAAYRRAADLEGLRGRVNRCAPDCSDTIRRVGAEEGVRVADLAAVLAAASRDGIPGDDILRDVCHWYAAYYPLASAAIAEAAGLGKIRPRVVPARGIVDGLDALRTAASLAVINGDERFNESILAEFEISRRLAPDFWARMTANPAPVDALFEGTKSPLPKELLRRDGPARSALPAYIAETFRRSGQTRQALVWFDRALALNADDVQARVWRAVALDDAGKTAQARRELALLGSDPRRRAGERLLDARRGPARNDSKEAS